MSPSPSEVTAHNEGDCWGDRRCPCCAAEIAFDETGDDA